MCISDSLLRDWVAVYDDVFMCVCVGYTVSSVVVGDWRRLYVAGAPRFKHKGKVILFELSNDGDVNIAQALNGEQVGLPAFFYVFTYFSRKQRESHLSDIKAMTPPTGRSWLNMFLFCRLDLIMAVRCADWISTRMASLMSFWLQLQCTSAQETRRPVESTSTPSVG